MKPHVIGNVVTNPDFEPCGRCGHVAGFFLNINGVTLCPLCPELRAPVIAMEAPAKVLPLPVPRTPQTAEDMCSALEQSIAKARR